MDSRCCIEQQESKMRKGSILDRMQQAIQEIDREVCSVLYAKAAMDALRFADFRRAIANTFARDPDFRKTYVDNVAMLLHDRYGITDPDTRNRAGDEIIKLIFED